jgi:hypothetical protein
MQKAGEQAKIDAQVAREKMLTAMADSKKRTDRIMSVPPPKACEDARKYGLELARKLVGGLL